MTSQLPSIPSSTRPSVELPAVLVVHNYYQRWGGEDAEFEAETELLRAKGHRLVTFTKNNQDIHGGGLGLAANTIWSTSSRRELAGLIADFRPDVVHFHNTLPQISPAAYRAARDAGVPVVQTVPNYRLVCLNGVLYRDGRICEDCLHRRIPWPGVPHRCYRGSVPASVVVAGMLATHRSLGSWKNLVDIFVPPTGFVRDKLVEAGYQPDRFMIKPNLIRRDAGLGSHSGGYALFAGRLSPEKGIHTLLQAWKQIGDRLPLRIAGDGPLASEVRKAAETNSGIEWLGHRSPDDVLDLMGEALMVIVPSVCYETFGLTVAEAYTRGTPVIASRIGGLAEVVVDGRTGQLVEPGDPNELAKFVLDLASRPDQLTAMGRQARIEFESKYTADANHRRLLEIYAAALARRVRT